MARKNDDIELLFKAFADQTRLRIIHLIGEDEVCVSFFVEVLNTNQPKISRHLAYLRRAGLVSARREGKWMHYRLVEPREANAVKIFAQVREWLANDPDMQRDKAQLEKMHNSTHFRMTRRAPGTISLNSHA